MAKKKETVDQEVTNQEPEVEVDHKEPEVDIFENMTPQEALAYAKAEAQRIISEAKTTSKPKAGRKAKPKAEAVLKTAEELEAEAEEKRANEQRIAEIKDALTTAEATVAELKTELKSLSGKSVVARGPTGVGNFVKNLITEGKTNDEIMEAVSQEWPDNRTNVNCINWYRNALKNWPNGKRPVKAKTEVVETEEAQEEDAADEPAETEEENFKPEFADE